MNAAKLLEIANELKARREAGTIQEAGPLAFHPILPKVAAALAQVTADRLALEDAAQLIRDYLTGPSLDTGRALEGWYRQHGTRIQSNLPPIIVDYDPHP